MKPLRVAILTLYPQDPDHIAGGVRAVSYNLLQGLRRLADVELHVLHCHGDIAQDRIVRDDNVTLHFLSVPNLRVIPNMTIAMRRLRRALAAIQPDVVHAHIAQYAAAASHAPYPWLYTIHGLAGEEAKAYTATWFDRLRYALYARYDAQAVQRARHLVAISDYVQRAYAGQTRATWHRINNPLADDFFARTPFEPQPERILFVGSITEVKDIATLLRAFARVHDERPEATLHLAGRVGSESYRAQLQAHVVAQGLTERVTFMGQLDHTQLLRAYAECAVVALSSMQENMPMAISEGMAAGKPVVATRVGGIPELVNEGETGYLVDPGDDATMAARLSALLRDPERGRRMGERARRLALERSSLDQVAAQYAQLYHQVTADPGWKDRP